MARPRSDELVAACGGTVVTVATRLPVERADPAGRGGHEAPVAPWPDVSGEERSGGTLGDGGLG